MFKKLFFLIVVVLLSACGSSSDTPVTEASSDTPLGELDRDVYDQLEEEEAVELLKIERILTDIQTLENPHDGKSLAALEPSLIFAVNVTIDHSEGFESVSSIKVFNEMYGRQYMWTMYDTSSLQEDRTYCWMSGASSIECRFYDPASLHRVNLSGWELEVIDVEGNSIIQTFNFGLPGSLEPNYEEFVYSEYYNGLTKFGVPSIPSLSTIKDGLYFYSYGGTQSFEFRFTSSDKRVANYSMNLWGYVGGWVRVASISYRSPSILSTPINYFGETRVQIPWSEVNFVNGYSQADVVAAELILSDPYEIITENYYWSNYIGWSDLMFVNDRADPDLAD